MTYGEGVAAAPSDAITPWRPEVERIVRATVTRGVHVSDEEYVVFREICISLGLNPLLRQIYLIRDERAELRTILGADGLYAMAARTGEFVGMEGPWYRSEGSKRWRDYPPDNIDELDAIKMVALRNRGGTLAKFPGLARMRNFRRVDKRTGKYLGRWADMPERMLEHRAASLALRRGFPEIVGAMPQGSMVMVNPDSPATYEQIASLHMRAQRLGWSDEERHARAHVDTFKQLTKAEASELIDEWSELEEAVEETRAPRMRADERALTGAPDPKPRSVTPDTSEESTPDGDPTSAKPSGAAHEHEFHKVPGYAKERCDACGFERRTDVPPEDPGVEVEGAVEEPPG